MENNQIFLKISELISMNKQDDSELLSLASFGDVANSISNERTIIYGKYIKKMNGKLGNNFSYFNYKITHLNTNDKNIELTLECNIIREHIVIEKEKMQIISKFKDKDLLMKIVKSELEDLCLELKKYDYLNDIAIKTNYETFNINIDSKSIELFTYKSPNWTIMGKSFSLRYLYYEDEFIYEIDHINLKNYLVDKERQVLESIFIKLNLLPLEFQNKYIDARKKMNESRKSTNFVIKMVNKIINVMKK